MSKRSIVWSYKKEELVKLVNESNSLKELVNKVGLNGSVSSNNNTVKKCLEFHGIDYEDLIFRGIQHKNVETHEKLTDDEVFVENSTYKRHNLKKRIRKKNLIPYKCAICGLAPEWNNKELVLIIDHINGINNDNRLNNLRFVCPNCNSQLSTFSGKNKTLLREKTLDKYHEKMGHTSKIKVGGTFKKVVPNFCKTCGKPIDKGLTFCLECYKKEQSKNVPNKESLIDDLLKLPFTKIGLKYGVSDNAVRKWCKKYSLPYKSKDVKIWRQSIVS